MFAKPLSPGVRQKYRFVLHGYVIMPEYFHLLMTEPELGDPSVVMKALKEGFTRKLRANCTEGNVWTEQMQIEKLGYMHRSPVKRGLVEKPEQWEWSSFRSYLFGETRLVRVKFQEWPSEVKSRPLATFGAGSGGSVPLVREGRSLSDPIIRCHNITTRRDG